MDHYKKLVMPISIIFFTLLIFCPVYLGTFAYHNDYRIWEYNHFSDYIFGYPESLHLMAIGRPLGMILLNLQLLFVNTIHAIWINQLLDVLAIALLGVGCFFFFQRYIRISQICALFLSILIISLPSMTINSIWITNLVPQILPLFLMLWAQVLIQKQRPAFAATFMLMMIALLIYPPATLFFLTLTFTKFLFGHKDIQQISLRKLCEEIGTMLVACVTYFILIKFALKPLLIHFNIGGHNWRAVYNIIKVNVPQYQFTLNMNTGFEAKWMQIKDYLSFIFSAWFPLFSWPTIVGLITLLIGILAIYMPSNLYLQSFKTWTPLKKTGFGLSFALGLAVLTALPVLAGPALYQINYRVTFATMAIIPIVLIFVLNSIISHSRFNQSINTTAIRYRTWQHSFTTGLILLILGFFVAAEATVIIRLFLVVDRSTEEFEKIRTILTMNLNDQTRKINIQRPVIAEANPTWLNADFGLDASSFMITGLVNGILYEMNKNPSDYQVAYGSNFAKEKDAVLIPKTQMLTISPKLTEKMLIGNWSYLGRPVHIRFKNNQLQLINDVNIMSLATIKQTSYLYASDWNTEAQLSSNGKELHWDNGTVWVRKA